MGGEHNWGLFGGLTLSIAMHAMTAAMMPTELHASVRRAPDQVSEMEFQVLDEAPSRAPSPPEPPLPTVEPPPPAEPSPVASLRPDPTPPRTEPRVREPSQAPDEASSTPDAVEGAATREPDVAPAEPSERSITAPDGLRIDPRAVAIGALDSGPRRILPQAQLAEPAETAREASRRLSEEHTAFLSTQANRRDYITRRGPPELHRRPDGSLVYTGSAFSARILPDGRVEFSDRGNLRFNGLGGPSDSVGATIGFDISDAAERRHGNDPYQAERRWFLGETEELRDQLMEAHRQEVSVDEGRRLRGSLERIWRDGGRTAAQRRTALFRVWDGIAEDETGAPARRAVLTFIRTTLPAGSPDAYSTDELSRLNGRRESREAFAPY
jgi:outer membrane biosynthesis protein TonB